jgi:hypothetical protein
VKSKQKKENYIQNVKRLKLEKQERDDYYNTGMTAIEIVQHLKKMNLINKFGIP